MSSPNPYQAPQETSEFPDQPSARSQSPIYMTRLILGAHLGIFAVCYLIVWLPTNLLTSYIEFHFIDEMDFRTSFRMEQAATNLIGILADGAIVAAIVCIYDRQPFTLGSVLATGFARWPKLWTTRFCVGLITVFGLICLIVPGVYFSVRAIYSDVIAVSENVYGPTAIQRSLDVTRGRFGEHFVKTLVVWGAYIAGMVAMILLMILLVIPFEESEWYWVAEAIVSLIFGAAVVFAHVYLYCWYRHLEPESPAMRTT